MKEYKETRHGNIDLDDGSGGTLSFPNNPSYQQHRTMLLEIESGLATLTPVDLPAEEAKDKAFKERLWRNAELERADKELYKVQDGRGIGLTSEWREYRNNLRDWPDSPNFTIEALRPSFVKAQDKVRGRP